MSLTVLSVAYPFAAVGPDATGGAEQVLSHLDAALVRAGHNSVVVACEGSQVQGALVAVPRSAGVIDRTARDRACAAHRRAIHDALERWPVDLVHMHGLDFDAYMPPPGVPVLATLHLPVAWYPADALSIARPGTWFNCVSERQHAAFGRWPNLLPAVENGIPVQDYAGTHAKRGFALVLARICPEKGIHLAIDAARSAGMPLLVAGELYDYPEHIRYFEEEIEPRLDALRRFIGPVGFARKRRLLGAARCLVVPSLVEETSSLVAREALAAGTPVIALARGALLDTIEHGRTGFLVEDLAGLAEAIRLAPALDPRACREAAAQRFGLERMAAGYFGLYDAILAEARPAPALMAS